MVSKKTLLQTQQLVKQYNRITAGVKQYFGERSGRLTA
jgi:hypothetical protein